MAKPVVTCARVAWRAAGGAPPPPALAWRVPRRGNATGPQDSTTLLPRWSVVRLYPEIAQQWHPTLNPPTVALSRLDITSRANVWWRCPHHDHHVWVDSVRHRFRRGTRKQLLQHVLHVSLPPMLPPLSPGEVAALAQREAASLATVDPDRIPIRPSATAMPYLDRTRGEAALARDMSQLDVSHLPPHLARFAANVLSGRFVGRTLPGWATSDRHLSALARDHYGVAAVELEVPVADRHPSPYELRGWDDDDIRRIFPLQPCPICSNRGIRPLAGALNLTRGDDGVSSDDDAEHGVDRHPAHPHHGHGGMEGVRAGGDPADAHTTMARKYSLAALRPALAAAWHPHFNGPLTAQEVGLGNKGRVWWQCTASSSHVFQAVVNARSRRHEDCPYCKQLLPHPPTSVEALLPDAVPRFVRELNGRGACHANGSPASRQRYWWRVDAPAQPAGLPTPTTRPGKQGGRWGRARSDGGMDGQVAIAALLTPGVVATLTRGELWNPLASLINRSVQAGMTGWLWQGAHAALPPPAPALSWVAVDEEAHGQAGGEDPGCCGVEGVVSPTTTLAQVGRQAWTLHHLFASMPQLRRFLAFAVVPDAHPEGAAPTPTSQPQLSHHLDAVGTAHMLPQAYLKSWNVVLRLLRASRSDAAWAKQVRKHDVDGSACTAAPATGTGGNHDGGDASLVAGPWLPRRQRGRGHLPIPGGDGTALATIAADLVRVRTLRRRVARVTRPSAVASAPAATAGVMDAGTQS